MRRPPRRWRPPVGTPIAARIVAPTAPDGGVDGSIPAQAAAGLDSAAARIRAAAAALPDERIPGGAAAAATGSAATAPSVKFRSLNHNLL